MNSMRPKMGQGVFAFAFALCLSAITILGAVAMLISRVENSKLW